jgi:exodeoxyribonuclease III
MKIISWNVNGIRAWHRKGNLEWFTKESPDIFCVQETKAEESQLPDEVKRPDGYYGYFDHSKGRKGYSGVVTFSKVQPDKVELGIGVSDLDQEGRSISLFFNKLVVINTYFPNGGGGPIRLDYKLKYYDAFLKYINKLNKKGYSIIFCGDINTAHNEIDLARPKENVKNTGFLPIERAWIDKVIKTGYIDAFRMKYPDKKDLYTYWDMKTFSRERNVGWRIDYFFVSPELKDKVKDTGIMEEVLGSDHCPIFLKVDINIKK